MCKGANVTLIVQLAPAARVVGQLLLSANSPKSCTPPMEMLSIGMLTAVGLVRVTDIGELTDPTGTLPKARVVAEDDMVMPKPVRLTTCVAVTSSSVTVKLPGTGPATVGLKVTLTVQKAPGRIAPTQLLVCWKGPVTVTWLMFRLTVLLLVIFTPTAALVVPTT